MEWSGCRTDEAIHKTLFTNAFCGAEFVASVFVGGSAFS